MSSGREAAPDESESSVESRWLWDVHRSAIAGRVMENAVGSGRLPLGKAGLG